ncbi:MAG: peptidoglycan DD-metalloendopeptidase family protein [Myxococcales bacterium]|nr:peptidoglycan DD-metalloendopeptidase family protein [Myxococcales bacterium]
MAKPQGDDGATPEHRPLPSVDLALLPHEVRASRARQVSLAVVALLGVIALVAFAFSQVWASQMEEEQAAPVSDDPWPSERGDEAAVEPAPAAAAGEPPDPVSSEVAVAALTEPETSDAVEQEVGAALGVPTEPAEVGRITKPFGQARGFRDALRRSGASPEEADALVAALEKLVDFRRCRPEHQLTFERGGGGQLVAFEYKASVTDLYRATRGGDGSFSAARTEVPIERRRLARGSHVAGSLGHALSGLGLGRSLASVFVGAFEGSIDFKKHTREGDSFKLVLDEEYVEGKLLRYGTVHALEYRGERAGHQVAFWFETKPGKGDYYNESGRAIHGGWLRTPLRYDHISSRFNPRRKHPILKRIVPHNGVDYAASPGTTVWAAADGTVTFAGVRGANGNLIALRHEGGYETYYAHLLRIGRGIKKGVKVEQRQPIGAVGSTGRSTGPHLHFALKRRGRFINPEKQLNGPGKPLPASLMPRFKRTVRALKKELASITLAAAPSGEDSEAQQPPQGEVFHEEAPLDL